jgi:hypothetical protein
MASTIAHLSSLSELSKVIKFLPRRVRLGISNMIDWDSQLVLLQELNGLVYGI